MKSILQLYKLLRGTNLIIIALSLLFFQYFLLSPMLGYAYQKPSFSPFYFSLLVIAVCAIAAAGNIINDYLDFENDKKFKPNKTVIGEFISLKNAFNLHILLNLLSIGLAYFLGYKLGNWQLGNIFVATAALLWLYSLSLKKYLLIGNIAVAVLSALVFLLPVFFEPKLYDAKLGESLLAYFSTITLQAKVYALFAFLVSLAREITKDAEDKEADADRSMKTLPVITSTMTTNVVISIILSGTVAFLVYVDYSFYQMKAMNHFWYILLVLIMTLFVNIVSAFGAKTRLDYKNLSLFLKLNMFFGVFSLPAFYFLTKFFGA